MGLDITAYRGLTLDPDATDEDDYTTHLDVYPNPHFPGREAPLGKGRYRFKESTSFRAGSYSGYNQWREWLATIAGYAPVSDNEHGAGNYKTHSAGAWAATEGPFWELINFADNEGTIGTDAAKKLAKDFADYADKALDGAGGWYAQMYEQWRAAFEMASDNGAVDFH